MSSSGKGQAPGGEKPHGLSKFMRRASKILKPKPNGPASAEEGRVSIPSSKATDVGPASVPAFTSSPAPASASRLAPKPKASPGPNRPSGPEVELIRSSPSSADAHYKLQEAKARALFAKYNLALEPGEWASTKSAGNNAWVEKQVRIRVHRSCHRCETAFGTEKTCSKCTHTRCKKCPRYPGTTSKDHKAKAIATVLVDSDPKYQAVAKKTQPKPTMMSKGGQEMTWRHPTHRVRRTCHKCSTLFAGKAVECSSCRHQRCPKCPREPAKLDKFPNGYPGDVEETFPLVERTMKTIRHRIRWECHTCKKAFIEHERTCRGCQHERCDNCLRWPPKKIKTQPHPDVIKSLEEKMAQSQLSPAA